jgi:hypothetical protein
MDTSSLSLLPTKANIVQRLLDEKLITAEEAVVLLTNETPTNIPVFPLYPTYPIGVPNPYAPPYNPQIWFTSGVNHNDIKK